MQPFLRRDNQHIYRYGYREDCNMVSSLLVDATVNCVSSNKISLSLYSFLSYASWNPMSKMSVVAFPEMLLQLHKKASTNKPFFQNLLFTVGAQCSLRYGTRSHVIFTSSLRLQHEDSTGIESHAEMKESWSFRSLHASRICSSSNSSFTSNHGMPSSSLWLPW